MRLKYSATILSFIAVLSLTGCDRGEEKQIKPLVRPVKTMTLTGNVTTMRRQFPGKVRASDRVDLSFQVSGKIIELPIKEGQKMEKDGLIAHLDDKDFRSNLKAAQANHLKSKSNMARADKMIKKNFISEVDYDRIRAQFAIDSSELQKVRKALSDTRLIAPFAGVIAKQHVQNFQDIQAKQAIVSFQDPSSLEIVVNVPEIIVAKRSEQSQVQLLARFEAVPDRQFDLFIKEHATQADPKTQTFEYVLGMPQPEGANILPGMTATVHVQRELAGDVAKQAGMIVPYAAIFSDDAGVPHVWVVDSSNAIHKRQVVSGDLTGDSDIRISSGLNPGETIAVTAVNSLQEGMEIRPVKKVEF